MPPTLFLLFAHQLTVEQEQEARQRLGVGAIRALPPDLQARWNQVPPTRKKLRGYLKPVWQWLGQQAQAGDYALIHGDFGVVYLTVNHCRRRGLIPIYATTHRQVIERPGPDGSVEMTRVFKHQCFRRYDHWQLPPRPTA